MQQNSPYFVSVWIWYLHCGVEHLRSGPGFVNGPGRICGIGTNEGTGIGSAEELALPLLEEAGARWPHRGGSQRR